MKRRPAQPREGQGEAWPGSRAVAEFLARQLESRRLSPRTCATYGRSLRGFARWKDSDGGWDGDWSRLTARD
ncbi:MAG: hypothetical protein ACO268_09780, partial [Opitutales bacterium]